MNSSQAAAALTAVMTRGVPLAETPLAPGHPVYRAAQVLEALGASQWESAVALASAMDPEASALDHSIVEVAQAWCLGRPLAVAAPAIDPADPLASLTTTMRASALLALGDLLEADRIAADGIERVTSLTVSERSWLQTLRGRAALLDGRLDDAARHATAILLQTEAETPRLVAEGLRAIVLAHQERRQTVAEWCAELVRLRPEPRGYADAIAFLMAGAAQSALGDPEEAVRLAEHGSGGPLLPRLPPVLRPYVVDLQVEVAIRSGDVEEAQSVLARCDGLDLEVLPMARAALGRAAAMISARRGEYDRAAVMAAVSSDGATTAGARNYRIRAALLDRLAAHGSGRDLDDGPWLDPGTDPTIARWAHRELHAARETLEVTGLDAMAELSGVEQSVARLAAMGWRNREIAEALFLSPKTVEAHVATAIRVLGAPNRVGLARRLAGDEERSEAEPAQLTPRQWAVVHLVADGATNEEIAERLGISIKTVEKHLTAVFRRLNVTTRVAVAAWARGEMGPGSGARATS